MAISETPTSSLSLRLPVGVSATLSGFMDINEGHETAPAHSANGPETDTPEHSHCRKARKGESRESE